MSQLDLRLIPVTPFQQNCSLLWDTDTMEGVLVDPGGEPEKLMNTAKELGIDIKEIWLTHGHIATNSARLYPSKIGPLYEAL